MKIGTYLCFLTLSNGLPFWGAGKFKGDQLKTTVNYCAFLYNVSASNLPAQIRRKAFRMIVVTKCYNRKVSQHRSNKLISSQITPTVHTIAFIKK